MIFFDLRGVIPLKSCWPQIKISGVRGTILAFYMKDLALEFAFAFGRETLFDWVGAAQVLSNEKQRWF